MGGRRPSLLQKAGIHLHLTNSGLLRPGKSPLELAENELIWNLNYIQKTKQKKPFICQFC